AGTRGAEEVTPAGEIENLLDAFGAGLRQTRPRLGISSASRYIGGGLVDSIDLAPDVIDRCFPMVAAWPGRTTLVDLGDRVMRRAEAARSLPEPLPGREARHPDPAFARYRAEGELHLFAPRIASEMQLLSGATPSPEEA